MHINLQALASWLAIAAAIGGAIFNYAVLSERSEKLQITVVDHEQRIDKIERDDTIKAKLAQLQESVNYLNWQVTALKEERKKR